MKKANDKKTVEALSKIIHHIRTKYPEIQLITEPLIARELGSNAAYDVLIADRGEQHHRSPRSVHSHLHFTFQTSYLNQVEK